MIKLHRVGFITKLIPFNIGTDELPVKKLFPKVEKLKTLCFECEAKTDMENLHFRELANGKPSIYGDCSECEGRVSYLLRAGQEAEDDDVFYESLTSDEAEDEGHEKWTKENDARLMFLQQQAQLSGKSIEDIAGIM